MKRLAWFVLSALTTVTCLAQWQYPPSKTVDASDTYFGKTYRDPYRWLESLKGTDVEAWFQAQATMTDGILGKFREGMPSPGNGWSWTS